MKNGMRVFFGVLVAGAFGGFLAWAYSLRYGKPLDLGQPALAAALSILLGAGAAAIGVYIIANTDLRNVPKALAFSILCGFSWQIVYDAGSAAMTRTAAKDTVTESATRATAAARKVEASSTPPTKATVQEITTNTDAALNAAQKSESPEAKKTATTTAEIALKAVQKDPAAVGQIGTSAVASGHPDVAAKAVETLAAQGVENPQVKDLLQRIETAARIKADTSTVNYVQQVLKHP
ncbi:MAG TPA: hypothetical protein VGE98_12250 [Thermoanaerobaculia bacterium]